MFPNEWIKEVRQIYTHILTLTAHNTKEFFFFNAKRRKQTPRILPEYNWIVYKTFYKHHAVKIGDKRKGMDRNYSQVKK